MYKQFSPELHQENDAKAKNILIKALGKSEFVVNENPDPYGIDILVGSPPHTGIEVEIKQGWTGHDFPFPDINIPPRKEKYIGPNNYFCVINSDLTRCALFHSEVLLTVDQKEVVNKYVPAGEEFFKIPLDKVEFFDLTK